MMVRPSARYPEFRDGPSCIFVVPAHRFTELTDREMEVLKLIANGLSNGNIAGRLVISENTVKGHVSNILSKLHLAGRTQAAVYAWREGIVRRD